MKPFSILNLAVLTWMLVSCQSSENEHIVICETIDVDYPSQITTLKGYAVNLEGVYTGQMFVYDTILLLESVQNPDGMLHLYNVKTGKRLNAICKHGGGPDEYYVLAVCDFKTDSNGISMWVSDLNSPDILLLNMQGESVKKINTSSFQNANLDGVFARISILNDSLLVGYIQSQEIFDNKFTSPCYRIFNYHTGEDGKSYRLYSDDYKVKIENYVNGEVHPSDYLSTFACIKPDKRKIAEAMFFLKRINIIDLKTGKSKNIKMKGSPDLENIESCNLKEGYYTDISCDNQYIYVLEGAPASKKDSPPKTNGKVQVFDWDGNFKHLLQVDESAVDYAFDPVHKTLYAKADDEKITAYDLKFLYP